MKPRLLFCVAVCWLAACASPPDGPTPAAVLRPYLTATPSLTPTPPLQAAETPLPTSTPFTYTVASGDTLSGIAEKFHVRLDVLRAANPGVSPNSMPIGTALMIPGDSENQDGEPSPTPVSLTAGQVSCYPVVDGGIWCFVLVRNDYTDPIENISAQVTLYDAADRVLASQAAISLLNVLPPGKSMPLTVFFPPSVMAETQPRVQMLTSTRLLPEDTRYLPAAIEHSLISIDWSGRAARASGKVTVPGDAKSPAGQIWVVAVAYAADGRVVGARRWESAAEVSPGGALDFSFSIASLGPPIESVELFLEARPK